MKINTKDTIGGFPVLKIRDLIRNCDYLSEDIVCYKLKVNIEDAVKVIDELLKLGLIEKNKDEAYSDTYPVTLQGNSLGNAKAIPSIQRAKADALFESFMLRVKELNKNPKYLYKISRIELFGSYNTNTETVNDIDIGYRLEKKGKDRKKWREKDRRQVRMAKNAGVNFNSFMAELFYTRKVALKYLKSRSPYLSLHDLDDDGIFEIIETKQVFPTTRNPTKKTN